MDSGKEIHVEEGGDAGEQQQEGDGKEEGGEDLVGHVNS